jgi:hypothetical protein
MCPQSESFGKTFSLSIFDDLGRFCYLVLFIVSGRLFDERLTTPYLISSFLGELLLNGV